MKTKTNKLIAVLLAIVMLLSALPAGVFTVMAAETTNETNIWAGEGTQESPYILKTSEDLKLLSDTTNNDKQTHKGEYFCFENDITLPSEWTPIGTSSTKFAGSIDGNNKKLTVPSGSFSLIGTPSGAVVKNLKLYGEKIPGYGLVQGYTTGSTIEIENVTILSGSHILYAGLIGGYGNASIVIRNCKAEKGVIIGDDGSGFWGDLGNTDYSYSFVGKFNHQDNIGSFAGAFNGTITGCVSYATVYGRNNVGGIVGMKGQSMREMRINDCAFYGDIVSTGSAVGGIVGNGYTSASAPSTPLVTIENCNATGNISGKDNVGGIFGGEMGARDCKNNGIGRIRNNFFAGTVSASAENAAVGGIMGYLNTLGTYTAIYDNYYTDTCGAANGIGKIVTTAFSDEEVAKTAAAIKTADLTNGNLLKSLNSNKYGRNDYIQGADYPEFGNEKHIVGISSTVLEAMNPKTISKDYSSLLNNDLTVKYNDGTTETVKASECEFYGVDFSDYSVQRVFVLYKNYEFVFGVKVVEPPKVYIKASVTILGDTAHGAQSDEIHTLRDNNLTQWVDEKTYSVEENSTVRVLLEQSFKAEGITFVNESGNYIQALTYNDVTLAEMTNGANSGWLYTVNGVKPALGIDEYKLQAGDKVVLFYTDNYRREKSDEGSSIEDIIKMIEALPAADEITLADSAAVFAVSDAFNNLSEDDKQQLTNAEKEKISSALLKIAELNKAKQEKFDSIYKATGDTLIDNAEKYGLQVSSVGGEWSVIGLARSGRTVPDGYYNNVINYVNENIDEQDRLHRTKSTDNSRVILALTSLGYDVTDVAGHNLLNGVTDMTYLQKQGINGPIWALIAFDSHNYEIPQNSNASEQVTRDAIIKCILDNQLADGGWSLDEDEDYEIKADVDVTAMAIQALAPYYNTDENVKNAVDKALVTLSELQNADGSYSNAGVTNSESCAQVIVALTALGIDPQTDSRFIKNGYCVLDALFAFYTGEGFSHTAGGELNAMATEQGYYALAAYDRFKNEKTSLYDMSDITIVKNEEPDVDNNQPSETETTKPSDINNDSEETTTDVTTSTDNNNTSAVTEKTNNSKTSPMTGNDNMCTYAILMALPLAGLAFAVISKRKEKQI